jgi:hypothetical protein
VSFIDAANRMNSAIYQALGEPMTFQPTGGSAVETMGLFDMETLLRSELGQVVDPRPSVELPKSVVGTTRSGTITVAGKVWSLDRLISDDGYNVRFFVK